VNHVKLLLDENLSPAVAVKLRQSGLDVVHIRDRGLIGATDPEVLDAAYREDRILVTANVADFEKLARARDLHAGIVFIEDGDLLRDEQQEVIRRAVAAIELEYQQGRDMVNRVMFIGRGQAARFEALP
jgi:predicted nuclease of predicted toxin-antitoxin system